MLHLEVAARDNPNRSKIADNRPRKREKGYTHVPFRGNVEILSFRRADEPLRQWFPFTTLQRFPVTDDVNPLQVWEVADEYLLQQLDDTEIGGPVLI